MTGVDTNVLVRYLTQDDPVQSRRANALVDEAGERLYVDRVTLCELAWVLTGPYEFDKATVVAVIERMLATHQFEIGAKDLVRGALEEYGNGRADFADYVIGEAGREAGCAATVTFDRRLKAAAGFRVLV